MKFNTFARYPFLAEYWGYTIDPADINHVKTFAFFRNVDVQMVADGSGRVFFFTRDSQWLKAGWIKKVTRKRDGIVVLEKTREISNQEPILSTIDNDVTYKYWTLELPEA